MAVAEEKATLIEGGAQRLRDATQLDERPALDPETGAAWYDRVTPHVASAMTCASALQIEVSRRRGEQLMTAGEQRGRPKKVSQRDTFFTEAEKQRRKRDRALAKAPAAVAAYTARETAAGRTPTRRGALRAVAAVKTSAPVKTKAKPAPEPPDDPLPFAQRVRAEVRQRIAQVQGQPLTLEALATRWGVHPDIARRYLREAAAYGDVVKDGDIYTVTFTPAQIALSAFATTLLAEVRQRRKEAFDGYRRWRPETVHTYRQNALVADVKAALAAAVIPTVLQGLHATILQQEAAAREGGRDDWRPDNFHTQNQSQMLDWLEEVLTTFELSA